jgi:CRP-like cAMP-binding protein
MQPIGKDKIARLSGLGQKKIYQSQVILYRQGDEDVGLVCIMEGFIRTYTVFSNGAEKNLFIYKAPAIIGETAILD